VGRVPHRPLAADVDGEAAVQARRNRNHQPCSLDQEALMRVDIGAFF
jgi:hypothetical protein